MVRLGWRMWWLKSLLPNHRLGKRVPKAPGGDLTLGPPTQVEQLELQLGQETVACSAQVVGESSLHQHGLLTSSTFPLCVGQRQRLSAQGIPKDSDYP
jgi:hypothetical protein